MPNTTYDSIRLNVHMNDSSASKLDRLASLANNDDMEVLLCNSFVSLDKFSTFGNQKFGISVKSENANIANASKTTQDSGCNKNFDSFAEIITINDTSNSYR